MHDGIRGAFRAPVCRMFKAASLLKTTVMIPPIAMVASPTAPCRPKIRPGEPASGNYEWWDGRRLHSVCPCRSSSRSRTTRRSQARAPNWMNARPSAPRVPRSPPTPCIKPTNSGASESRVHERGRRGHAARFRRHGRWTWKMQRAVGMAVPVKMYAVAQQPPQHMRPTRRHQHQALFTAISIGPTIRF